MRSFWYFPLSQYLLLLSYFVFVDVTSLRAEIIENCFANIPYFFHQDLTKLIAKYFLYPVIGVKHFLVSAVIGLTTFITVST